MNLMSSIRELAAMYRVPTLLPQLNSLPFPDILICIPYQFCMKVCVKSHVNIKYFKIPYFLYK